MRGQALPRHVARPSPKGAAGQGTIFFLAMSARFGSGECSTFYIQPPTLIGACPFIQLYRAPCDALSVDSCTWPVLLRACLQYSHSRKQRATKHRRVRDERKGSGLMFAGLHTSGQAASSRWSRSSDALSSFTLMSAIQTICDRRKEISKELQTQRKV